MKFWEWMCLQHISMLYTQPVRMYYPYRFTCGEWCVEKNLDVSVLCGCGRCDRQCLRCVLYVSGGICSVFIMVLRTMRYLMGRHVWSVCECVWERVWEKGEVGKWPCTEPRQIRTLHGGRETEEETSVGDGNEKWDGTRQLLPQPQKECWYHARMSRSLTVRRGRPRWEEGWLRIWETGAERQREGRAFYPGKRWFPPVMLHQNPRVPLLGPRKANSYIP